MYSLLIINTYARLGETVVASTLYHPRELIIIV